MTLNKKKVFINTCINEYSDVFKEDGKIIFCNFCNLSVEWKFKSTIDTYCLLKNIVKENKNMKLINKKKNKPLFLLLI